MSEFNYPDFDASRECGDVFQVSDVDVTEYDEEYQRIREEQIERTVPPEFRINVVRDFMPQELGENHFFYARFAWRYYPSSESVEKHTV